MVPDKRYRPKRSSVEGEEEKAWIAFYRRVRIDAPLAVEILSQLDHDPEMKRTRLALYLSCRQSIRRHKSRQIRHKRLVALIRWLVHTLIGVPWTTIHVFLARTRDLAFDLFAENEIERKARPRPRSNSHGLSRAIDAAASSSRRSLHSRSATPGRQ